MGTSTGRFLVTGGAGFIGSHLCEHLLGEGHSVICLDNFHTGTRQNIARALESSRFECLEQEVYAPLDLQVDGIFHLACPASPVHYQTDPVQTNKTSVLGTLQLLELAHKLNIPLLFTSTSEVYGDPLVHPQPESYWGNVNCRGPRACYDEGKRCAETFCWDFLHQHSVDVRVARLFNTYGPHMHPTDGRVVSNFIVQALRGEEITIYGDGSQSRSFCYISDTLAGLLALWETPIHVPVNIGNPQEFTVLSLAKWVMTHIGERTGSKLVFKPLPQDDPLRRQPDITRAKTMLGWEPKVSLEDGLLRTVAYFEQFISQTSPA